MGLECSLGDVFLRQLLMLLREVSCHEHIDLESGQDRVGPRLCVVRRTFHTMSHMRHPSNRDVGQETKTDFGPQLLKD
jgi:hypothetical protein